MSFRFERDESGCNSFESIADTAHRKDVKVSDSLGLIRARRRSHRFCLRSSVSWVHWGCRRCMRSADLASMVGRKC
jgi:hypothetical protein